MSEQAPDELILKGLIQIETALDALTMTGANPAFENQLVAYLRAFRMIESNDSQPIAIFSVKDDSVVQAKADVLASLEAVSQLEDQEVTNERRLAAIALKELLS